jgi:hypothetical protein
MDHEHVKLLLLTFVLVVLLLSSCSSARQPATVPPPVRSLPSSPKGYELYGWRMGGEWYFTLITGTNRVKTYEEVTGGENVVEDAWVKVTVKGTHDLEAVLEQVPTDTLVLWVGPRQLRLSGAKPGGLAMPPRRMARDIASYCEEAGIQLEMGR